MSSYKFSNPPTADGWTRTKANLEHIDDLVDEDKPGDVAKPGGGSRSNIAKVVGALTDRFNSLFSATAAGKLARDAQTAAADADRADAAKSAAMQAGRMQPDIAAGIAAYNDGEYFTVPDASLVIGFRLYRISSGAVVEEPVNTALSQNASTDITQMLDAGGASLIRLGRHGELAVAGAQQGVQNAFLGMAMAEAVATEQFQTDYGIAPDMAAVRYRQLRAMHENRPARKQDFEIVAADEGGTKLQRIPGGLLVRPGKVFITNSQKLSSGANIDNKGLRLVGRYLFYDVATLEFASVSDPFVIDEPDGYKNDDDVAGGASLFLRDNGDIVAVYKCFHHDADGNGTRDVAMRIISGSIVSDRRIIAKAADTNGALPTENGSAVVLQHGPNVGRWIVPVYHYSPDDDGHDAVLYSDDQGANWAFSDPFPENNEWAVCQLPDGSIVGSGRKPGKDHIRFFCPASGGGISDWESGPLDYDQWFQQSNNRSIVCTSLSPEDGIAAVLWCSTIPVDAAASASSGTTGRRGLGLRVSLDKLTTVSHVYRFSPTVRPAGYSHLMSLGNGFFLVIYETGFNSPPVSLRGTIFNLSEVLNNGDPA